MNTLVSFELAKLLKERGFGEKSCSFYDLTSNTQINDAPLGNYNLTKQSVSIPNIPEVVMWLYEKHGIWIYLVPAEDNKEVFKPFFRGKNIIDQHLTEFFNSPTEAYEAAIEYTLNNLI